MRLVLLPGLGADARLFEPQSRVFPELEVPPWIPPLPSESLASYARRLAETLPEGEFLLGGVSFGGMIALEMARVRPPRAVVLIGSARSGRALAPWLHGLAPVARALPAAGFSAVQRLAPGPTAWIEGLDRVAASLFRTMLRDMPVSFFAWGCRAILAWGGPGEIEAPVLQIHGRRDHLLPLRLAKPDRVIEDGRHLISLTHPVDVNAFLAEALRTAP